MFLLSESTLSQHIRAALTLASKSADNKLHLAFHMVVIAPIREGGIFVIDLQSTSKSTTLTKRNGAFVH